VPERHARSTITLPSNLITRMETSRKAKNESFVNRSARGNVPGRRLLSRPESAGPANVQRKYLYFQGTSLAKQRR
jgi:hypothetical protein